MRAAVLAPRPKTLRVHPVTGVDGETFSRDADLLIVAFAAGRFGIIAVLRLVVIGLVLEHSALKDADDLLNDAVRLAPQVSVPVQEVQFQTTEEVQALLDWVL